jgi:hypothetical protein
MTKCEFESILSECCDILTFSDYLRTYLETRKPLCRAFAEGYSTNGGSQ